jgi:hypothetical protein
MAEIEHALDNAPSAMEIANAVYGLIERYTEYHDEHYDDHKEPEMPEWMMTIQQGVMGLMA